MSNILRTNRCDQAINHEFSCNEEIFAMDQVFSRKDFEFMEVGTHGLESRDSREELYLTISTWTLFIKR